MPLIAGAACGGEEGAITGAPASAGAEEAIGNATRQRVIRDGVATRSDRVGCSCAGMRGATQLQKPVKVEETLPRYIQ